MRRQHMKVKAKQARQFSIICAIVAILGGIVGVIVLDDATALLTAVLFTPALFFKKHTYY